MKKILLIVITSFAFTEIGSGGLNFGAFPGSLTFGSLTPGAVLHSKPNTVSTRKLVETRKPRASSRVKAQS